MSIADRITSMSNNLSNAYDGIEYLGVDTTGVDKNLQNLSSMLNVVYEGLPKVSDEGVSPSIDGSRVGRLKSTLKASDTTQFTTTGKNLLNVNADLAVTRMYTLNNISIPAGTYHLTNTSATCSDGSSNVTIRFDPEKAIYNLSTSQDRTITLTEEATVMYVFAKTDYPTSAGLTATVKELMLSTSGGTYEPYTGGIPSPNPDYPQDIHVVKGNNSTMIKNKSLIDWANPTSVTGSTSSTFENDILTVSNTSGSYRRAYWDITSLWKNNIGKKIYFQNEGITQTGTGGIQINVMFTDGSSTKYYNLVTTPLITIPAFSNISNVRLNVYANNTSASVAQTITITKPMLFWGEETTDYITPINTTYPINLPEGLELCKIGDYQDYIYRENGNWYKYGAIGEVVLNGSEAWQGGNVSTGSPNYTYVFTNSKDSLLSDYAEFYCDKFKVMTTQMVISTSVDTDTIYAAGTQYAKVRIMILTSRLSEQSLNGFKTWLSNNNITMYHVLATPTITQITDTTLISQLNALYNAMSYSGETNVLQTNADNPFVIYASALKGE